MPDLSAVDVVGFFGAILGAAVVLFANRVERLRDAAMRLRSLLLKNGHDIWNGGREPIEVVNSNYIEVQAAYLDLRRMALWRRKRLDDAWVAYSGTPHYRDIPDSEP